MANMTDEEKAKAFDRVFEALKRCAEVLGNTKATDMVLPSHDSIYAAYSRATKIIEDIDGCS